MTPFLSVRGRRPAATPCGRRPPCDTVRIEPFEQQLRVAPTVPARSRKRCERDATLGRTLDEHDVPAISNASAPTT
jgi:hypothetical protein